MLLVKVPANCKLDSRYDGPIYCDRRIQVSRVKSSTRTRRSCLPALATTNCLGSPKMLLFVSNSIMTVLAGSFGETTTCDTGKKTLGLASKLSCSAINGR